MIDILMSTFNGADFLEEQIDSILSQEGGEFRLVVRDDGSTDNTVDILQRKAKTDPRIRLIKDDLGNLGAARSFMKLLESSDSDLFMLSDQDDVWLPGKVASARQKILQMTDKHGSEDPLLAFTDLTVCDAGLKKIGPSFWKHQRLDPAIAFNWKKLLAQNVVTGCTIVGNAAARRAALPFALPEMMHDHWIAVNAARSGHVDFLPDQTVLYRQHGQNALGAVTFGGRYAAAKAAGIGARFRFYKKAAKFFGCSAAELVYLKGAENLKRFSAR